MRASNDGTANPVTVVVTIRSTSSGLRPASSSALDRAAHPSSTAFSMKMSFASPKSVREDISPVEERNGDCRLWHSRVVSGGDPHGVVPGSRTNASVISSWV